MLSGIPPEVRKLIYLTSFSGLGYGYFIIAVAAYLPEIGFSAQDVGLLLGMNGIVFVLSAIPIGILADKRGRKGFLLAGLSAIPPILFVYAYTKDFSLLLAAAVVAGIGEGAYMACWNAMIADQTTLKNRNEAFSLSFIVFSSSFGLGMALPFAFPAISDWTGQTSETVHNSAFVFVGLLSIVSPIGMWFLLRDYKEDLKPQEMLLRSVSRGPLLKFSAINSIVGLGAGFIIPLVPTWLVLKFDVSDVYSGPLLAVSHITIGLAALVSARLAKRYGMIQAIVLTQSLATVFMLSLAYAPGALLAGGLYMARAALMNMSSPLSDSFLMSIISKEERGFASAINSIVWRLPNSASTVVGGMLLASGDYVTPFLLATGFYAISVTLMYVVFKDVKPKT